MKVVQKATNIITIQIKEKTRAKDGNLYFNGSKAMTVENISLSVIIKCIMEALERLE